jgi:chromosome segregation ATPase
MELVKKLESFEPPAKPENLLELEQQLRELREQRAIIDVERTSLCRRIWHHDTANAAANTLSDPKPSRAELAKHEAELERLNNQIGILREQVDQASEPWRHAYSRALDTYSMETRERFTDFLDDLDKLMKVYSRLAGTASAIKVGSPWIMRQSPNVLNHSQMIRGYLQADVAHR